MSIANMQKLTIPTLGSPKSDKNSDITSNKTSQIAVSENNIESNNSTNPISLSSNLTVCKNKTVTSGTSIDYSKVAILLESNDTELLEKYREKLKQHEKQSIQFIPGKRTGSMEQAFIRLKKQGIRFVTVCDEKVINNSPSKILKYNEKWHKILSKNDLMYICPDNIFGNNVATVGLMTRCIPNETDLRDIAMGVYTLNSLMNNKNGQSVIVQSGKVLGIESEAESTADLIDRCIDLKNTPKGGILYKSTKPHQRFTLLYPTIDLRTVVNAHTAKLSGIVVKANCCHIENMQKLIKFADRKKIFILGI